MRYVHINVTDLMIALIEEDDLFWRLHDVHGIYTQEDRARHTVGPAARDRCELRLTGQRIFVEFSQDILHPRHQDRVRKVGSAGRRPWPVPIAEIGMGRIPGNGSWPRDGQDEI